jgi:hypothetical protein
MANWAGIVDDMVGVDLFFVFGPHGGPGKEKKVHNKGVNAHPVAPDNSGDPPLHVFIGSEGPVHPTDVGKVQKVGTPAKYEVGYWKITKPSGDFDAEASVVGHERSAHSIEQVPPNYYVLVVSGA